MTHKRLLLAAIALSMSLALAACGSKDKAEGPPVGEPIAPIAAPAGQSWVDVAAVTPEDGFRIGNPDAPLKLVEFASHTCPHCAEFSKEGSAALNKYVETGVVSYEIRNQIHDALDLTIAMLARCGDPAAFHPLADQVWANFDSVFGYVQAHQDQIQAAMQDPGDDRFQRIAQAAGLFDFFAARGISHDQAMQCLADPKKAEAIMNNSNEQSKKLDVQGTPTFFINGNRVDGTLWSILEPALQKAGAR